MTRTRILVVDDEPSILDSCQSILAPPPDLGMKNLEAMASDLFGETAPPPPKPRKNGDAYEVIAAEQGQVAVELTEQALAEENPFAVAFVDMRMPPGIDGLETASRLQALDPDLEVVIVTAFSDTSVDAMGERLGEDKFLLLRKPFAPDELLQMANFLSIRWLLHHTHRAYERFVPKEFLGFLRKDSIVDVKVGDHVETELSILFADVRAFTALSESLTPNENFRFLNSYLNVVGPMVRQHQGVIDKFMGDGIMALFEADPDHALQSGISMQNALAEYNEGRGRAGYQPIRVGIGINTGRVILGMLGEDQRMDSTVVSDAVNLAARTEQLTKEYGVGLLISDQTHKLLKRPQDFCLRIVDHTTVPGRTSPLSIYEVFDADPEPVRQAKLDTLESFNSAFQLFHSEQIPKSQPLFKEIQQHNPEDTVVRLYLKRCQYFEDFGIYEIDEG